MTHWFSTLTSSAAGLALFLDAFTRVLFSLSQNGWDTLRSPCPLNVGVIPLKHSLNQNGWDTLGSTCRLNVGVQDLVTGPR